MRRSFLGLDHYFSFARPCLGLFARNSRLRSLTIPIPFAIFSTVLYGIVVPSPVVFAIQLNDPLISSSSNAPKLNSLLGNTRSDPTLISYLVSQKYLCRNLPRIGGFIEANSRLTTGILKRCRDNRPLPPYIRSTFAKGERYEDLQAVRFTLESFDVRRDFKWIANLAAFYSNQSKSFASARISAVNNAIQRSEASASLDAQRLRNSFFALISKHRGPLDEKYKAYSSQLVELEKLSAGYQPQEVRLVSLLAAQLNLSPHRVQPLIPTISGLNRDDSEQLLKSLQEANVRILRLRAGSSSRNPEYKRMLALRASLIKEMRQKVVGFDKIAAIQPNPDMLSKVIDSVIDLQSLRYQISENKRLTAVLLESLRDISRELPQYILLQSKIAAQDDAIAAAAKDNENLKIELNKLVGTWEILEGPFSKSPNQFMLFALFYVLWLTLVILFHQRVVVGQSVRKLLIPINTHTS